MTTIKKYSLSNVRFAQPHRNGFALIASITVMILLVMIALAMLSLSTIELRSSTSNKHQAIAQANARLALMQAMSELQKHAGPDQRVTARAAILENDTEQLANRNWLGVWTTTRESGGQDWPVIGKSPAGGSGGTPYARPGAYEDLRHTSSDLANGAWKDEMRLAWLVSNQSNTASDAALSLENKQVVELVGKGTLGDHIDDAAYASNRVRVEKVDVNGNGAYAWYVSDNNQKASVDPLDDVKLAAAAFEAAPRSNPALIDSSGSGAFAGFLDDARKHPGKLVSYLNASLTQGDSETMAKLLGENVHHLTTYSPGLFTDTSLGGLRRDLTPLLLANKGDQTIDFPAGEGTGGQSFSSSWPIIPGPEHGVLGPSFGALRNWAQHTHSNLQDAETSFPASAIRMRPTAHWPHNISDGACADASKWAESAPKIHPVMTDSRWHYYFSHHNKRIRTHIIPRVCLWNPYNRELKISAMTVLMPNPFYGLSHGMHFFPEENHVNELKDKFKSDPSHVFSRWVKKSGYVGGSVYKMRTNPFPTERYLGFVLEGTTLEPGQCHVFSPKVTSADLSANGVNLQRYQSTSVSANVLSSSSPQGMSHYYYDHASSVRYQIQATSWRNLSNTHLSEIDFDRIFDYQPEVSMQSDGKVESFPFVLKAGSASSLSALYSSNAHPTIQLVNSGAGGAKPTTFFGYIGQTWGSANQQDNSFGYLQTFADAPLKDAPDTHQVGAKLLWFDESGTEANNPPLRVGRWTEDHMVYNVAPIANWNVRAQLTTRSPAAQCAKKWYMTSMGPWLLQFVPHSPQDVNDQPSLASSGALVKNPFGSTVTFPFTQDVVLFDLPSEDYGVLSVAKLRHAMLSPYSWMPSYVVGHSLRNLHAPSDHSAHNDAVSDYTRAIPATRWDYLIGGSKDSGLSHGPYAKVIDSQGLLQIGNQAVTRSVDGTSLSSRDEVLAYDVAYEVNQNLWDRFFISGMPLTSGTQSFDWDPDNGKDFWNTRYQYNYGCGIGILDAKSLVTGSDGVNNAFWRNAEWVKNKAAFNINSTSVGAWAAFLSGTLGEARPLKSGELGGDVISFARHSNPQEAVDTAGADPDKAGAWVGARKLTDDEVRGLAETIVAEVKKRGPFVSLADFINRRLGDSNDQASHMGALDAAINKSGLNANFEKNAKYQTTSVNVGTRTDAPDNNLDSFKNSYRYRDSGGQYTSMQPVSQAWGLPGFLTQGDLLEPLAPAMTVRGDTFTVRAYGESSDNGEVKARSWLEVTVERAPQYVDASGNSPGDIPLIIQQATGQYLGGSLTETNKRFGRQFVITSMRWLSPDEI